MVYSLCTLLTLVCIVIHVEVYACIILFARYSYNNSYLTVCTLIVFHKRYIQYMHSVS